MVTSNLQCSNPRLSLLTQPSLTGVAGGTASDNNEPEFSPSPAMAEITVNFLVRMAFLTGEGKDQTKELNAKTLKLLKRAMTIWKTARVSLRLSTNYWRWQNKPDKIPRLLWVPGLVVFDLALECEVEGFVEQNVNQIAQFIDPCVSSSSAGNAQNARKSGRHGDDEEDAHAGRIGCEANRSERLAISKNSQEQRAAMVPMVATRKTATIKSPSRLNPWIRMLNRPAPAANTGSQGQPPTQVSASALLSPEAKILRLKIDEACAKRIGCRNHGPTGIAEFAGEQSFFIRRPCFAR